ncbi:hypothetical protein [Crocosphaera chwakensis]|uniref:Uncharacterized protein n=1 Tax=Crocosphaera chwakensis CCY0110 TaxID=391612 RepID=A3IWU0_9CHRO|nr:hypothetical protein [Crocosphaera chwakensis]EAZ89042.1 hypothetical protein CY0110_01325 [Crocosphaera chwakensis CCY0110]
MTLKPLNLSEKLQRKQKQRWLKPLYWLGGGMIAVCLILSALQWGVPWHWQLFFHWLVRGEDINSIPVNLHSEIREFCQQSQSNGQVDGYKGSPEIAYGLGKFKCRRSSRLDQWEISDQYGFAKVEEAAAGTQMAEILVALVGTDYFYEIKGTIPTHRQK